MRFVPSVLDDSFDLFDDVFDDFRSFRNMDSLMRTDVEERDGKYIMNIELPGFNKEDIRMSLKNGTLRIAVKHHANNDERDNRGNILRQERFEGSMMRSFYVGNNVKESDIRASYQNGVLTIEMPDEKQIVSQPETKYIDIE